jgi:hypothetical protein
MENNHPVFDPEQVPDISHILNLAIEPPNPKCGIYFLIDGKEIVYIGQSVDSNIRIAKHISEGEKMFTHYYVFNCRPELLNMYEAFCLWKFQPKYNIHLPIQPFITVFGAYIKRRSISMRGKGMAMIAKVGNSKRYWSEKELDQLFSNTSNPA